MQAQDAHTVEFSLLTSKWDPKLDTSSPTLLLAKQVVDGQFREALTSSLAQTLLTAGEQIRTSFEKTTFIDAFSFSPPDQIDELENELVRLAIGVACLHAFIQVNWTGPDLQIDPASTLFQDSKDLMISEDELNRKAISELAYGGEPAYHLTKVATFLRLAQILFDLPYTHLSSVAWWRLRASVTNQRILDEPVAPLPDRALIPDPAPSFFLSDPDLAGRLRLEQGLIEHHFGHGKNAAELFIKAARQTGLKYELTGALGKKTKFQQDELSQLVLLAESRKRDGDETSSETPVAAGGDGQAVKSTTTPNFPETLALNDDTLLEKTEFTSSSTNGNLPALSQESLLSHLDPAAQPALHPLDQCILLSLCLNVRNTSPSHGLTNEQMMPYVSRVISHPRNWSVHTMALLLRSRLEASRTRTVERSVLQLQALVDQMPTADSQLIERLLYFHELPLPSKWEMERELALRFLSIGVVRSALEILERLEMWEEVVKCWQSLDRQDKAIAIVRDLLEGRKQESETVIARSKSNATERRQYLDKAREAKLWCLLGDLEPDHAQEHYEKAWTISGETSGRAMRSLGGFYFARGEYARAIPCLLKAAAINPLLSRTWFILGCACAREEKWDDARNAFARCVSIDDEDGESWNNLASVYLRMGVSQSGDNQDDRAGGTRENSLQQHEVEEVTGSSKKEAEHAELLDDNREISANETTSGGSSGTTIPFEHKLLAFRALKQGLKFSYENWRMWMNYMIISMEVGELAEACRAQGRVVEERASKDGAACIDEDVIDRLVDAVTRAPDEDANAAATSGSVSRDPNGGTGLLPRVRDLLEVTILPRVSSTRVYRAYARLLSYQGRWSDAIQAYMDGYRSGRAGILAGASGSSTALEDCTTVEWREAVNEVEELVDILRNFGPRAEAEAERQEEGADGEDDGGKRNSGSRWELQARSVVRTFMARTRSAFEDEPDWSRLERLSEELRKK